MATLFVVLAVVFIFFDITLTTGGTVVHLGPTSLLTVFILYRKHFKAKGDDTSGNAN